jgi:hypothetical protein
LPSITETPIVPPVVGVIVIGEYSRVPVLSPTGKVKGTAPLKTFCTSLPPVAITILDEEGVPPIELIADKVKSNPFRFKFPEFKVNTPSTVVDAIN